MTDSPERKFPGKWDAWPVAQRKLALQKVRDHMLAALGPGGLVQWLYAGTVRPDGARVPLNATVQQCWELLSEDVAHPPSPTE